MTRPWAASSGSSASSRSLRSSRRPPPRRPRSPSPPPGPPSTSSTARGAPRTPTRRPQEPRVQARTDPRKADSDRDGLKDGDEVTSGNDPRKADTDRDGVKDGAEHAGVVTAFDGETITIRQFNGPKLVAVRRRVRRRRPSPTTRRAEADLDDGYVDDRGRRRLGRRGRRRDGRGRRDAEETRRCKLGRAPPQAATSPSATSCAAPRSSAPRARSTSSGSSCA